ncbi:MAG: AraC family transcriptional regulator [Ruminococcus sp.]|nr:AraC family transcriptional regulator [Ruminococcus sp.]
MAFESMYLEEDIHIDRIYTIHYFEYKSDFHFAGERHNFWEFQCVDKGKAEIETDNGIYHLTSGQLIFHRPNEFHNLIAIGNTAPNIVVVSFECDSPCMKFFEKKLLKLSDSERNLMGMLIAEARRCIATPLDDPYTEKMEKKEDFLFGSQQLIRENQMNFAQISEFLGYSSIHYFSRQFKKISGMTPTEYITSIKALSERERQ